MATAIGQARPNPSRRPVREKKASAPLLSRSLGSRRLSQGRTRPRVPSKHADAATRGWQEIAKSLGNHLETGIALSEDDIPTG